MFIKTIKYTISYILFFPAILFAQAPDLSYLNGATSSMRDLISTTVPVLIGIGLLVFIWGMVVFIMNFENEQARAEGKRKMVWGIIILFVIVSVWGIVNLIQTLTNITGGGHGLRAPSID